MQLALCKVLFPRLRGQSVCPSTFSVLLMMWEMFSAEHKRTSSPSHSNECDSQNESVGVTCLLEKGVEEVSTCPFHLPVNINGEEGNHCHSSRYSTKRPDCILDSDMLLFFFFFLQGNQMFSHSVTDSLPDCPKTSMHQPPPTPHVFESNSSSVPFSIPASQLALRWISVYSSCG